MLCFLIRVFNCVSRLSLKPEFLPKFSKSLKLKKIVKNLNIPLKIQNAEKTVKMRNYTPDVEHGSAPLSATVLQQVEYHQIRNAQANGR